MLTQIILLVICQTIVADNSVNKPYYDVGNVPSVRDLFENSKNYDGAEKEEMLEFVENFKDINYSNEKHQAILDVDGFADLRPEEKLRYPGLNPEGRVDDPNRKCKVLPAPTTNSAPIAWNWLEKNAVVPIKDQMNCNASWAFATAALVASRYAMKHNKLVPLSQQQLVDCDDKSKGCTGGDAESALKKIMEQGGLEAYSDYPYEEAQGKCRFNETKVVAKVTGCTIYDMKYYTDVREVIYTQGPIVAGIYFKSQHGNMSVSSEDSNYPQFALFYGFKRVDGRNYVLWLKSWQIPMGAKCATVDKYISATVK